MFRLHFMTILLLIFTASPSEGFHLEIPLDAHRPPFWIIQNYVDRDPTEGYRDYMCGYLSYDKHRGTDFRVPFPLMVKGVCVRSAAPGIVVRTRDHVPDDNAGSVSPPQQSREEAGNAVLVDHENGFRTLYAHLRKGSVMVRPGGRVHTGEPLGLIGMSGRTEFPHLHFAVMYRGDFVCPFAGVVDREDCGVKGESLWSENALKSLPYMPSGPISSGFTDQVPDGKVLESEIRVKRLFTAESPAIIFWTLVYGLRAGDREVSSPVQVPRQ
jgi:murein DD-endopeptidase MepM/ murein hydrolase activator NlpD